MPLTTELQNKYIQILKEELVPALGCTEPIAIAYVGANLRKGLGSIPTSLEIAASGNIIKNAKSVIVPNTNGMKGIGASAVIGLIGGNTEKGLEVLADVTQDHIKLATSYLKNNSIQLSKLNTPASLHIKMIGKTDKDICIVELIHQHTNIVLIKKNDEIIFQKEYDVNLSSGILTDRHSLNIKNIIEFADTVDLNLVSPLILKQAEYNMKVAKAGLTNSYGINTGQNILKFYQNKGDCFSIKIQAQAEVAAAADARMCGCPLPVITNSGSGNQGLSVSVPVIVYARELGVSEEKKVRSLIVSNLIAIHQKTGIGRLSAYCGAVTAASACGAAITYMKGGSYNQICATLKNSLGTVSGIICDGAKQSCAAKVASALDSALFSHYLAMEGNCFDDGDGIVKDDIEKTIAGIGIVAAQGMKETDKVVLDVMLR